MGDLKTFDPVSRFILTFRNTKNLTSFNENRCELYEVGLMNQQLSFQLFCKHTFEGNTPQSGFETLANFFFFLKGGVSLVLKVVGSSLLKEGKPLWEYKLAQLEKIPHEEIIQTLKTSYEPLENEAHQVFLDVACFYIGVTKEVDSYMWSDPGLHPGKNITPLFQRSLIKIGDDDKFQMDDQLEIWGGAIVREENIEQPWMKSRIWDEKEALDLLPNKKVRIVNFDKIMFFFSFWLPSPLTCETYKILILLYSGIRKSERAECGG
ncbi:unnamed protein product [Linum tenue]|uniref:Disease resistance protein Roq1-like winged-helix domain-containing protein n=1 Tax=Linum tenue TaxID=586396 RepID=A0AAV0Q2E3_9ROSI|nr:unnamed protein product [Linum tenue]